MCRSQFRNTNYIRKLRTDLEVDLQTIQRIRKEVMWNRKHLGETHIKVSL